MPVVQRADLTERRKVLMHWLLEQHFAHPRYGFVEWRECMDCHNPYPTWRVNSDMRCYPCRVRIRRKRQWDERMQMFISRIRRELELVWKLCGRYYNA